MHAQILLFELVHFRNEVLHVIASVVDYIIDAKLFIGCSSPKQKPVCARGRRFDAHIIFTPLLPLTESGRAKSKPFQLRDNTLIMETIEESCIHRAGCTEYGTVGSGEYA